MNHKNLKKSLTLKVRLDALKVLMVMLFCLSAINSIAAPVATEIMPQMDIPLNSSRLIRLPDASKLDKVTVDDPSLIQVTVTSVREVALYPKKVGSTVVVLKDKAGRSKVIDINVIGSNFERDVMARSAVLLQSELKRLLPEEHEIKVDAASDSLVLTGTVFDALKVNRVVTIAEAYTTKKVVNMLQVSSPQQVMLEVKMAEVSKSLLDKLGSSFNARRANGGVAYAIAAGFLSLTGANPLSPGGLISVTKGNTSISVDAEKKDGIIKILAEPNIMAISGQEGSFLAGGKLFIPVPQAAGTGLTAITLEEKEFGIGLKFTPTVLEGDLINLRVAPEVSELSQSGTEIIAGGGRSVLPSFITRRTSTTVQLRDGQSFAIAGLIKNNVTETVRRFPILGDIPILGALFRSSEFQNDKTELLFVITPRLVKPLPPDFSLPTDKFVPPSSKEFFIDGKLEGKTNQSTGIVEKDKNAIKQEPFLDEPAIQGEPSGYQMK